MSEFAIRVENLGKKYRLRHQQQEGRRYKTLRDALTAAPRRLWNRLPFIGSASSADDRATSSSSSSAVEDFWALQDVSFEIAQGEAVGIIGRNGAGKSTLLKLLSRITSPTTGRIDLNGRVASLLEVGTGFHPELTGRENIFLNGAILGMSRAEIKARFDEIVAFAEVERFLDTPVKRYSSGMYMRLAFAVAAHLEPEILIVDEVLAVGDAEFQKKCLGKMGAVSRSGRTVLFVSHNMAAIEQLTTKCVLLGAGSIGFFGTTHGAVSQYLDSDGTDKEVHLSEWKDRSGDGAAKIVSLTTLNSIGNKQQTFRPTETIAFRIAATLDEVLLVDVGVVIENEAEQPLFCTHLSDSLPPEKLKGPVSFQFQMQPNALRQGHYKVSIALFRPDQSAHYDVVRHYPGFQIEGDGAAWTVPHDARWGSLYFPFQWKIGTQDSLE